MFLKQSSQRRDVLSPRDQNQIWPTSLTEVLKRKNNDTLYAPPSSASRAWRTNLSSQHTKTHFATSVFAHLDRSFDSFYAISCANSATNGEFFVYGGTLRRVLLNDTRCGDIDIIINDGDNRLYAAFKEKGVPYTINSNGHRRYLWNKLQIDVAERAAFFGGGAANIDTLLTHVDLKINALALDFSRQTIIDPYCILEQTRTEDPGINWIVWEKASGSALVLLTIRLVRILFDNPTLSLDHHDVDRLVKEVIPIVKNADWAPVANRFPYGREVFLRELLTIIGIRTRVHHIT